MSAGLDSRLLGLQGELDEHARIARYLGLDLARPVRSLADGYPENAIALVGKITERLLKQLWIHHGGPGTPDGKALAAASNDGLHSSRTDGEQFVQLWDLANLQAPPVKHLASGICSVRVRPDSKREPAGRPPGFTTMATLSHSWMRM